MIRHWLPFLLAPVVLGGCNRVESLGAGTPPVFHPEEHASLQTANAHGEWAAESRLRARLERIPEVANLVLHGQSAASDENTTGDVFDRVRQAGTLRDHHWVARDESRNFFVDSNVSRHGDVLGVWVLQNRSNSTRNASADGGSNKTLYLVDCVANTFSAYATVNYAQRMAEGGALGPMAFNDDIPANAIAALTQGSTMGLIGNIYCGSRALAGMEAVTVGQKPRT